jgi:hypothetical protein
MVLILMLSYIWKPGGHAYPSWTKIAKYSGYDPKQLRRWRGEIERMGYVRNLGIIDHGRLEGHAEYDVTPLFQAIALAEAMDPESALAKRRRAPLPRSTAARYGWKFDWGVLDKITGAGAGDALPGEMGADVDDGADCSGIEALFSWPVWGEDEQAPVAVAEVNE